MDLILFVVNAYTQFNYGYGKMADYDAIEQCMKWIKDNFKGKRFGLPLIGAGLAGGDWNKILQIINDVLGDEDITIIKYKGYNMSDLIIKSTDIAERIRLNVQQSLINIVPTEQWDKVIKETIDNYITTDLPNIIKIEVQRNLNLL